MRRGLAVAAAGGAVFLFAWEQVQATRLGFELEKTRHAAQEARGRNAYLRLELERRTAPAELADLAREKLGMVPPSPDAVVQLAQARARPLDAAPSSAPISVAPTLAAAETQAPAAEASPALRTQLLGWLLPPDPPRWR